MVTRRVTNLFFIYLSLLLIIWTYYFDNYFVVTQRVTNLFLIFLSLLLIIRTYFWTNSFYCHGVSQSSFYFWLCLCSNFSRMCTPPWGSSDKRNPSWHCTCPSLVHTLGCGALQRWNTDGRKCVQSRSWLISLLPFPCNTSTALWEAQSGSSYSAAKVHLLPSTWRIT